MKTLEEIYNTWKGKILEVVSRFPDEDIEGPLLATITQAYNSSNRKILIFGQQTNGWYCDVSDFKKQMSGYVEFNMGEKYRSTPFWDFVRRIEKNVNDSYYSSMWLNLNRFDMNSGRPNEELEKTISVLDPIILEEIDVLSPEIVIFLTGPNYDNRISSIFRDAKYISVDGDERLFAKISSNHLPELTFRTYHPGYLRRAGLEDIVEKKIIERIKT